MRLVRPSNKSVTDQASYLLVTAKKLIIRHSKDASVQEKAKISQLTHEVIAGKEMFGYSGKPDLANEDGLAEAAFWRNLNESEGQMAENLQEVYQNSFAFYRIEDSGEYKKVECENVSTLVLDSNQVGWNAPFLNSNSFRFTFSTSDPRSTHGWAAIARDLWPNLPWSWSKTW